MKHPILVKVLEIKQICAQSDENEEGILIEWFEEEKFEKLLYIIDENPHMTYEELQLQYHRL